MFPEPVINNIGFTMVGFIAGLLYCRIMYLINCQAFIFIWQAQDAHDSEDTLLSRLGSWQGAVMACCCSPTTETRCCMAGGILPGFTRNLAGVGGINLE